MIKILTILGARPQFIKAGSVSREIAKHKNIEEIIVHTGQHYDANMSDIFFEEMQIPKPNYFLGIGGKSHGAMTGQMIEKIEEVALKEKPDWVMVYGDTNSTLAGAIVASKLHIKIAHIEAGLRSFNMKMPEEVNRILTDRVSQILFCPTDAAVENLQNEGYENLDCKIVKSGDVMQDGAIFYKKLAVKPSYEIKDDFVLCTIHRAENTDDEIRLKSIFESLNEIAREKQVILPLHPRTKKILENLKLNIQNLTIIDPIGYLQMVWLIDNCSLVMTDSGGLQKEAYFFGKQCITLRDETEWVELIECEANVLVGANGTKILEAYKNNKKSNTSNYQSLNLYGGGEASKYIIKELLNDR
ncbi:non-hydrolyzing UDP-N-acetylglucosamine 2-epimerase [Poseidonibacter ostreae]|uniref:UDP-N-acetylglucosamine 2-epimerase (Non-hydrolyzing) n=1 Tax=Poseidonibacter ostreae TaxID=2654171 RepID=A0A6L4WUG8_9BACT|nr:UDP-N-acetylglucosamine 2-epimerase (non-hydrolyzing) [Poseidonibacter ostreae]KAB7889880.1 UDP-N-acetylglucosamine 2-epimerase (non-hydrolyzing) [Poseidonibacter ostreae]KAB7890201.1 UDP-N-acetylglucosamine 2-epimerase (non-hydrolyzing) [Poseidonibacter ostreae]